LRITIKYIEETDYHQYRGGTAGLIKIADFTVYAHR